MHLIIWIYFYFLVTNFKKSIDGGGESLMVSGSRFWLNGGPQSGRGHRNGFWTPLTTSLEEWSRQQALHLFH